MQINSWDIAKPLLLMMVSPLIIGLFIKAKLSAIAPIIQPILFKLSNAGLLLGLVVRLIVHTSPVKVTNSRIIMPCDRSLGKTFWFTVNKPSSKRKKTTSAASSDDTPPDDQDFEENPATATINITAVEIPELTEEEQRDRLHLERRVERAVFEAGKALMELRI
ncbi:RNAseH domain-containing protein [Nostoc sp. 'Lobaria pulmonaria (5183) cyanobiont']|uniref:RNAseH domain-containing protein n=1 Tax=Nostoc sp. 'Lobaria pulmonaria (5183) cyanobiont' TaxID=1618022 RepID=UPI001F3FF641|nr:RNAseH domain-containing protein [Nostoc sp. 'Lobaria pulmonaria (5183) cyanobiont']